MIDRLRFAARALRHSNYRLFFFGQALSLIGTWITRVAVGWLVYQLTDSALMLGVVGFAAQLPAFLVTPLGGVLSDRIDRRRTLIVAQAAAMAASLGLAYFALRGTIAIPHVLALSVLQGLANAIEIPTRQAFVVQMLEDRADLSSAIAMNSAILNGARLIGPATAGILIAWVGVGLCFLVDGLSFLAVIAALLAMRTRPLPPRATRTHLVQDLRDGAAAAFGFAPIRAIILLLAFISLVGLPYIVLLPVFAERVLSGGALTLGALTAASGVGALCGAGHLALRRSVIGLERMVGISAGLLGLGLLALGMSRSLWLSLAIMPVVGFGMMVHMAGSNSIVQSVVDDDKRGRVMSFFVMAFMGALPIGNLLGGGLADVIGAPETVMLGGVLCLAAAAAFTRALPHLRSLMDPVYADRGLLPVPVPAAPDAPLQAPATELSAGKV